RSRLARDSDLTAPIAREDETLPLESMLEDFANELRVHDIADALALLELAEEAFFEPLLTAEEALTRLIEDPRGIPLPSIRRGLGDNLHSFLIDEHTAATKTWLVLCMCLVESIVANQRREAAEGERDHPQIALVARAEVEDARLRRHKILLSAAGEELTPLGVEHGGVVDLGAFGAKRSRFKAGQIG